jgi:cyclopropane fatty-acyl-phospholipid synthase-like methyltransferase
MGLDGSQSAIQEAVIGEIQLCDLREQFTSCKKYDLVMSFEVAEHLHEEFSDNFLDNIVSSCKKGGVVVFTAAPPGQSGKHHINLKRQEWWIDKFERRDFSFQTIETEELVLQMRINFFIIFQIT